MFACLASSLLQPQCCPKCSRLFLQCSATVFWFMAGRLQVNPLHTLPSLLPGPVSGHKCLCIDAASSNSNANGFLFIVHLEIIGEFIKLILRNKTVLQRLASGGPGIFGCIRLLLLLPLNHRRLHYIRSAHPQGAFGH
jgi:hypothetical protein